MDINVRNKLLGKLGKKIGGQEALVLFDLIEKFPDRLVFMKEQAWMLGDKKDYKKLGMSFARYQECINVLIGTKYIDMGRDDRNKTSTIYRINFEQLEELKKELSPDTVEGVYEEV